MKKIILFGLMFFFPALTQAGYWGLQHQSVVVDTTNITNDWFIRGDYNFVYDTFTVRAASITANVIVFATGTVQSVEVKTSTITFSSCTISYSQTNNRVELKSSDGLFDFNKDIQINENAPTLVLRGATGSWNLMQWIDGTNSSVFVADKHDTDELIFGLTPYCGNQFVLSQYSNYSFDHDHLLQPRPTLFIHSEISPDTDNRQWGSLSHDTTYFKLNAGLTGIQLATNTVCMGFLQLPLRTTDQLWAMTPTAYGQMYFCISSSQIWISTGTTVNSFIHK